MGEPLAGARGPGAPNSLARRLSAYLAERFPVQGVVTNVVGFMAAMLYGKAIVSDGDLHISFGDVAAVAGLIGFMLLARVFDEHKDYEFDVVHLSDRPLPRGAISWREVDGLGVVAVVVQVAVCVAVDGGLGPVCFWWAIAMSYLVLTRFEFFVRPWLRRHFVTNTVTHLPVYALASVWAAQIGAEPKWLPLSVIWLALFTYVHTFGIDLWRKSHAPEDERPAVDSYTQQWGTTAASAATTAIVLVSAGLAAVMLTVADAGAPSAYAVLAILPIPLLASIASFARAPNRQTNQRRRSLLALTLVGMHLVVILTLILDRGVA
ncbi:MAG TPA: UbiA family prenyltransferase [Solirubrobacteraceae bacterium]|nr:UbiA family prenyltransferase [Solirubrobacteraceae bacterium]